MFTAIVTTMDMYVEPTYNAGSKIIDLQKEKQGIREYQKVIAIGDSVRNVKVGDMVCINPARYMEKVYKKDEMKSSMDEFYNETVRYRFNVIELDGKQCLLIDERDVDFVIEEYEE